MMKYLGGEMELRSIISFCKIASLGSYSKAAESLGYTQSTLTAQIKNLESELNVKLVEKSGRGIKITEKGKVFFEYAQRINSLIHESMEAVSDENNPKGTLKIGVIESLCTVKLPQILEEYHEKYPEVNIELKVAICSRLVEMLKNNMVDLIIIIDKQIENNRTITYYSKKESIAVLCSSLNKLSASKNISIHDLNDQSLILTEKGCSYRQQFEEILNKNLVKTNIIMESGSVEAIKGFVKSNLGIAVLPEMTVENELKNSRLIKLDLEQCNFSMYTQVLYNKDKYITKAMKAFLDMINSKSDF